MGQYGDVPDEMLLSTSFQRFNGTYSAWYPQ
jgi:hypothetical protein